MAHGITPIPPVPAPRPDLSLAQDCKDCHEWGTVVTSTGHHKLCPACQRLTSEDIDLYSLQKRSTAHPLIRDAREPAAPGA